MTAISIPAGEKSCERARFAGERILFVRIVVFRLMFAGAFNVLHCMDQMAVGNHGMMRGLLEFSGAMILSGAALMLGGMLQQLGGFQMMIDALLRHTFRIANGIAMPCLTLKSALRCIIAFVRGDSAQSAAKHSAA
jgi:hypothetical protein